MKKILVFIGFLFIGSQIQAQTTIGGGVAYGTEIESIGIDLTGQYFFSDNLAGEVSFTYYFPKDYGFDDFQIKWYEINANVNYYFGEADGSFKPYGIGGLNMAFVSVPTFNYGNIFTGGGEIETATNSEFGLNIGAGADFDMDSNITPFAQIKYVIGNANQLQILAGIRFNLN